MQSLPIRVKTVWLFSILIEALFWASGAVAYLIGLRFWDWLPQMGLLIIIGLGLISLIIQLLLIPYRYRFYHFQVNDTDVEIEKGFFFRHHIAIPIARVQNVDLNQGPLLISQSLYQVVIDTGGSSHKIDALNKHHAEKLKERVMQLAMEAKNAQ
ncbi:PH domain-containing protein [Lactobacillus sp. Sy-1]|uniref:PH domain-containing protein n=1 Tax=Lactobacillus sp. Sy-1 TaxID=2109645 RepID=UPI001C584BF9|nr:PH domain-containing protein [Lactobacillus sp. Sy-1]MBW1604963.1 PH domain-containing protein [Lactobacillus sp. Sy-1]